MFFFRPTSSRRKHQRIHRRKVQAMRSASHDGGDLSLASAVKRHVRFVYKQANQNQRRAAKLLGIYVPP